MPIVFKCPKCSKMYKVKDELAGKVASCGCGVKFKIPTPKPKVAAAAAQVEPRAPAVAGAKTPPPPPPPGPKVVEENPVEENPVEEEPVEDEVFDEEPADAEEPQAEALDEEDDVEEEPEEEEEPVEDIDEEEEKEEKEDDEEEEEEEEEAPPASKGWPGRILIILGAALIAAALFLPWCKAGVAPENSSAPAQTNDGNKDDGHDADQGMLGPRFRAGGVELAAVFPKPADTRRQDSARQAPVIGADAAAAPDESGEAGTDDTGGDPVADEGAQEDAGADADQEILAGPGYGIPLALAGRNPILWAIYGLAVAAVLLLLLAIVPFLSGTVGMAVGLVLTLAVAGSAAAALIGVSQTAGAPLGRLLGGAGLGLYLALGGTVLCCIGGLLSSLTVFKGPAKSAPAKSGRAARGARGARGGARPARSGAKPGKSASSTVRVPGPKAGEKANEKEDAEPGAAGKSGKKPIKSPARQGGKLKPPLPSKKKGKVSRKVVLKPKGKGAIKPPSSSRRKK